MDPYSVLGVRKNASETEIELAFKGRRSQYHPDRYAKEGEETIRWATIEMQRVNEAYGVLTDPKQRARLDEAQARNRGQTAPRSTRTAEASRNGAPAKPPRYGGAARTDGMSSAPEPSIVEYFARLRLESADQARLFVAPSIPTQKAQNAISARGWEGRWYMCDPLVLIDDTLRGGAKEGLLIGEKCISFKSLFVDPEEYILQGGFNGGFEARGAKILRMGDVCKEFVHFSSRGVALVCQALNEYFDDLRAWHRNRAENGDAESANFMSMSCHGDPDQALYWLRRAADAGLRVAQHNLARNLEIRDPAEAFRLFKLAADQGCESSRERMRQMGNKASEFKENEDDAQREHEEDESQDTEVEEAVLQKIEVELQERRLAAGDPLNKALFTLMASLLKASRDFARVLEQNDFELDDEEQFVLSSDIVRFELLAFIFSNALNMLRSELGDDRAAGVLAVCYEMIIAEAIVRKEQLSHLAQISGPDKIRQLKHSKLFTPFQSRMHGFRGMSASSQTAAMFVENIQDPVMYALYTAHEQEIIGTMVSDVVEDILDEDTVEALLGEVERAVWTAIENFAAFGGR